MRPKVRNNEILVQELEKELLIYDLKINKAYSLNETCAMVWRECDGTSSISEIASVLSQTSKGLINEEVVWLALDTLRKENLIEESFEMNSKFNGMNRRAVIRKIGFASMTMLPLITSLVVPTAANAQSGGACFSLSSTCTNLGNFTQSDCCDGLRCNRLGVCTECYPGPFMFGVVAVPIGADAQAANTACRSHPDAEACCTFNRFGVTFVRNDPSDPNVGCLCV